ncbi:4-hydroxy-tetrahydrodipicolinate reductase [Leucobacter soli]|uniref:4-hydroxy-tetrahydrodipicolinate reductase n=1 Tax=Leucobacter soli TaxID=2812850 RepID=UPI00361654DE
MSTGVAVSGARGRLGSLVCEVVGEHPAFELVAQLGRSSGPDAGTGAGILVDVSHPEASPAIVERALRAGQRVVVGTSGWSEARLAGLQSLIEELDSGGDAATAVVIPNFSLGSVLGTVLARVAAPYFDSVEIVEAHHDAKVDSPSGTAVRTAELIADARAGEPVSAPYAEQRARGESIRGSRCTACACAA